MFPPRAAVGCILIAALSLLHVRSYAQPDPVPAPEPPSGGRSAVLVVKR